MRYDRNALKTPIRSGKTPRSLLLQKVDEDGETQSRSFLASPRARSRSISISSPKARSQSISSLDPKMLVDERLQLEEERRRFLLRNQKNGREQKMNE